MLLENRIAVPTPLASRAVRSSSLNYDPRWTDEFTGAAREPYASIGPAILGVHHVGSTAVPGLCAKPVLDILFEILAGHEWPVSDRRLEQCA